MLEGDRQTPCVWPVPERNVLKPALQTERSWWVSGLSDKVCLCIEPYSWASHSQMWLKIPKHQGYQEIRWVVIIPCNQFLLSRKQFWWLSGCWVLWDFDPPTSITWLDRGQGKHVIGIQDSVLDFLPLHKPFFFSSHLSLQSIHYPKVYITLAPVTDWLRHLRPSQQAITAHPAQQGHTSFLTIGSNFIIYIKGKQP